MMTSLERRTSGDQTEYVLEGRVLANGDAVELRLRGNRGWADMVIEGLPDRLKVRWTGDDGQRLHASLTDDSELRWP
ncbi:MAG: hypothetical protein JKY37_10825 [Nannocystaceae bacterium]|nr:hypothetical protein [Nannocystaceae bacterium]